MLLYADYKLALQLLQFVKAEDKLDLQVAKLLETAVKLTLRLLQFDYRTEMFAVQLE